MLTNLCEPVRATLCEWHSKNHVRIVDAEEYLSRVQGWRAREIIAALAVLANGRPWRDDSGTFTLTPC